jgi:hypothetical protein
MQKKVVEGKQNIKKMDFFHSKGGTKFDGIEKAWNM